MEEGRTEALEVVKGATWVEHVAVRAALVTTGVEALARARAAMMERRRNQEETAVHC